MDARKTHDGARGGHAHLRGDLGTARVHVGLRRRTRDSTRLRARRAGPWRISGGESDGRCVPDAWVGRPASSSTWPSRSSGWQSRTGWKAVGRRRLAVMMPRRDGTGAVGEGAARRRGRGPWGGGRAGSPGGKRGERPRGGRRGARGQGHRAGRERESSRTGFSAFRTSGTNGPRRRRTPASPSEGLNWCPNLDSGRQSKGGS
jgi:hypothetical protein